MSGNVVDLAAFRGDKVSYTQGPAKCLDCAHEWEAMIPVGEAHVECPECETLRGVRMTPVNPAVGDTVFTCQHCQSTQMTIYRDRVLCAGCGFEHDWSDVVEG